MPRFLNPYNFVRPLRNPRLPFPSSESELQQYRDKYLLWRCPPPPHDRYIGLSGSITCSMRVETMLFIGDGDGVADGKGHKTFSFFQIGGVPLIPASSVRGPIRSVFEAATNSTWSMFDDSQRLSYREAAGEANKLVPGRVAYDATADEGQRWSFIRLDGGKSRNEHLMAAAMLPFDVLYEGDNEWEHGQLCFAIMVESEDTPALVVEKLLPYANNKPPVIPAEYQAKQYTKSPGYLCITGDNNENKNNERFFFRLENKSAIPLFDAVVDDYNLFVRGAQEYHADAIKKARETGQEDKLSRYLTGALKWELIHAKNPLLTEAGNGFVAYAQIEKDPQTEKEQVKYVAPVSIPRVLEKRSLKQVLIDSGFDHLLPAEDYNALSLADRVFGWVSQQKSDDRDNSVAYRGRVRFTNAMVSSDLEVDNNVLSLSILSGPKPTTTRFYVDPQSGVPVNVNAQPIANRQSGFSDKNLRYERRGNMLRGRKFYRHHGRFFQENFNSETKIAATSLNSDQNRSIQGAHKRGTTYRFTIHFENLFPVELGALLWTLQLQDNDWQGYHRIGYGKPLGLGSVQISCTELQIDDIAQQYSPEGFINPVQTDGLPLIPVLVETFQAAMSRLYNRSFDTLENILDLKALLGEPNTSAKVDRIHYPRGKRVRNTRDGDENYTWFMDNKRVNVREPEAGGPNFILPYATDDTDGFPYLRWQNKRVNVDE